MDNKELVRLGFEKGCVEHDMDAAYELVSEDYVLHERQCGTLPAA